MYEGLVAGLPKTMKSTKWTRKQKVNVRDLEDIIKEYSYGDRPIDADFTT